MAARTGLIQVKRFTYRDQTNEEFSNRYHFKDSPPGSDAAWAQLATDLWAFEQEVFPPSVELVYSYGYNSDNPADPNVWSHDWAPAGTGVKGVYVPTSHPMAGDQAACVEWKTDAKNGRGKPIWLRKYLHGGFVDPLKPDELEDGYMAALQTYANGLATFYGGLTAQRTAYSVISQHPIPWVTTRSLKRRGKRPPLPA